MFDDSLPLGLVDGSRGVVDEEDVCTTWFALHTLLPYHVQVELFRKFDVSVVNGYEFPETTPGDH